LDDEKVGGWVNVRDYPGEPVPEETKGHEMIIVVVCVVCSMTKGGLHQLHLNRHLVNCHLTLSAI